MQPDTISVPINAATISLIIGIAINVGALIWGAAVLTARMVALTDRFESMATNMAERMNDLARVVENLSKRVGDQGERIAALESRQGRKEGS